MSIPKHLKITKDQKELTPEQLVEAKRYAQEKIRIYLSTKRQLTKKEIKTVVANAYKVAGLEAPKKIVWFDSPDSFTKHWASVGASVWASVRDSVRDSVWASVRDSVRDSVWASVRASVRDSVRDSVWASVGASVWASVRDSVRDSVWASVRDSVGASVWASVGASVWAYYDADDWSFYGFFNKYFEKNNIVWLQKLSENTSGYYFFENECWLVDKPKTLELDEKGRLHSTEGKAIEWKDGYGFYYLHGVEFDEKLWKQIKNPRVHAKTIMTLDNMEQRMAAIKLHGLEKIINKGKLIGESSRGNKLYKIVGVFDIDAYFLSYQCPSTGREYISGIDPKVGEKGNADGCMAWKFGLTQEEYNSLEIET